jgi:pantoate--beta-alanine ligase
MIKVFTTRHDFDNYRNSISNKKIGLVPTMGNLHEGHISLLAKAIAENDISIMTIFVNPKQFGPTEDFDKYPRTLDQDLTKIENLILKNNDNSKEVIIFAPKSNDEIYPKGFTTNISIGEMKTLLCGKFRPIHFDGVTTVVYRLFAITKPHNAYFGQKDYQQCIIIKKMIDDLELPIQMHIEPIVRNSMGLALSSRNQYLSESELQNALHLPKTLRTIEKLIETNQGYQNFISEELKNDQHWDYLEVLDADNLQTLDQSSKNIIIVAAYRLGQTRLLDNILVKNAR